MPSLKEALLTGILHPIILVKKIILTTLNKPDSLFGNTVYSIKWQQNDIDLVNLYYSPDNGASWQSIINGIPASSANYDWTVVNAPTNLGRIKITDASDSSFSCISDSAFIIRNKILQITSPVISSTAYQNTALSISWNSGGVSNLRISILSNNKDSVLVDSIPAVNESFNWIIKQGIADSFRLIISDRLDSTVKDTSVLIILKTLPTAIAAKYHGGSFDGHTMAANTKSKIQLLYPNGGEALSVLNNYTIKWRATNIEHIGLDLSLDSGKTWTPMADSIAAAAYAYTWKTPNSPSPNCFLRIRDELDSSTYDISDSIFVLSTKKLLNITDSTNWIRGTAKSIEWQPLGIETIRILYKTTANADWSLLKDSVVASNEILNWILPTNLSDSLWIRMVDITDSTVKDDKAYFGKMQDLVQSFSATKYHGGSFDGHTLRSNINKIIINHPDANEVLTGGVIYNILWSTINLEDTVLLQYSIDSGATWVNITSTLAQSGIYQWSVPATYTTNSIVPKTIGLPGLMANSTTSKTIGINGLTTFGTNIPINSNKCQIRALDVSAGNIPVGTSNKTFSIYSSAGNKKIDTLIFPQPADLVYGQSNSIVLQAKASSNREVKYIIKSGNAILSGNTVTVSQESKIIVGVYVTNDSSYYPLDTLFRTFCANPIPPAVSNLSYYQNAIATPLTATTITGDTLRWYGTSSIGGTGSVIAPIPLTLLVGSTDYYVSQYNPQGCESGRSKLTVTVVFNLPSTNFKITNTSAACKGSANGSINITAAQHLNYTATIVNNSLTASYPFTDSILINNLTAGIYSICLTVAGQSTYQQCFTTVVTEPKDLSLFMVVKPGNQVVINLGGANTYSINLNGTIYTTNESQLTLSLVNGNNSIKVTSDKACQGTIERNITVSENVLAYPNPFENMLNLDLGKNDIQTALISIISTNGELVYSATYTHPVGVIKLDLSQLIHGLYMLKVSTDHLDTVIKIIKK